MEKWNAGEMGCGQLIFELSVRMNKLEPGSKIEITACDPGAPTDLPAWCRMTGHTLISSNPPVYIIRRKMD